MNSKQLVLTGIIATSLLTTLVLNDLLPGLLLAIIVLIVGLAMTYFIALNNKRAEDILNIKTLIKASTRLHQEESISGIIEQMYIWADHMNKCEKTFIQLPDIELNPVEEKELQGLSQINKTIIESQKTLIANQDKEPAVMQDLAINIKSFIGVPVKSDKRVLGVLYQINKLDNSPFNRDDQMILETICEQAALAFENTLSYQEISSLHLLIIKSIINTIDARIPAMAGHSERVTAISMLIGTKMGLTKDEMEILKYSAMLHDIGYLEVQRDEDTKSLQHSLIGASILPATGILTGVKQGILYHHERYNGEGYPEGLSREAIPLTARIIAVADVYDALVRLNSQEKPVSHASAVTAIKKATGSLFDPLVVVAFEEVEKEIEDLCRIKQE